MVNRRKRALVRDSVVMGLHIYELDFQFKNLTLI